MRNVDFCQKIIFALASLNLWYLFAEGKEWIGSKEAEEEAEQKLEIAIRILIDTQGWGGIVWKVAQGVNQVGDAHVGVALEVRLA